MKVRFSREALRDLDEIGEWIAADDPIRAQSYVNELIEAGESLAEFPLRYPPLAVRSRRPLRRCNHGNHAILYEVKSGGVRIVAIVHGARDLDVLF